MKRSDCPKPADQRASLHPATKEALLRFIRAVAEADAQRDHSKTKE
jgi:hypothetical protein